MKQQAIYGVAVVIAFAIILSVMVAFTRPLQVAPPSIAVVDGRSYGALNTLGGTCVDPIRVFGVGQFPDPANDARNVGEAFTMTTIYTAWLEDGTSQHFAAEARVRACFPGALTSGPDNFYYRFLYSEDGKSWEGFTQDAIPAGVYAGTLNLGDFEDAALGAYEVYIDGYEFKPCTFGGAMSCTPGTATKPIKDGAALKVEVWIERRYAFLGLGNYPPTLLFEDQVELRSALPEVTWTEGGYEVGQSAVVQYTVPTTTYQTCDGSGNCQSHTAYFFEVRNMNTNGALPGFDRIPLNVTSGSFAIPVLATYFSNDLATCQNRLRALLYSPIIIVDQADASVQQKETVLGIPAPIVTGIDSDKEEYQEGDLVSISWTVSGNFTKNHVTAHIGGLVVYDRDQAGTNASFVAPRSGILEVEVTAYNRCQPSDVKKEQFTVGNVYPGLCNLFPDLEACREADLGHLLRVALGIIGLLVLLVLLLWVFSKIDSIPPLAQIGLPVLVVVVLAAYLLGTGFFAAGLVLHRSRSSKRRVRT